MGDRMDALKKRAIKSTVIPLIKSFDLASLEKEILEKTEQWELLPGEQYFAGLLFSSENKICITKVTMSADNKVCRQLGTVTLLDGIELLLNLM